MQQPPTIVVCESHLLTKETNHWAIFCYQWIHLMLDPEYAGKHYDDVIMSAIASQITSLTIVYSIVDSDADQRKHQSSATLAFVWGIHRGPVNSPHKWPVTRKMFPFDDVIMTESVAAVDTLNWYWLCNMGRWLSLMKNDLNYLHKFIKLFTQEIQFENIVSTMVAILSRRQCVKMPCTFNDSILWAPCTCIKQQFPPLLSAEWTSEWNFKVEQWCHIKDVFVFRNCQ